MKLVKELTYIELQELINKNVRFISDCVLFKDFDIKCKIISIDNYQNTEHIFNCKILNNGKIIKIGSNMSNLQFEILN